MQDSSHSLSVADMLDEKSELMLRLEQSLQQQLSSLQQVYQAHSGLKRSLQTLVQPLRSVFQLARQISAGAKEQLKAGLQVLECLGYTLSLKLRNEDQALKEKDQVIQQKNKDLTQLQKQLQCLKGNYLDLQSKVNFIIEAGFSKNLPDQSLQQSWDEKKTDCQGQMQGQGQGQVQGQGNNRFETLCTIEEKPQEDTVSRREDTLSRRQDLTSMPTVNFDTDSEISEMDEKEIKHWRKIIQETPDREPRFQNLPLQQKYFCNSPSPSPVVPPSIGLAHPSWKQNPIRLSDKGQPIKKLVSKQLIQRKGKKVVGQPRAQQLLGTGMGFDLSQYQMKYEGQLCGSAKHGRGVLFYAKAITYQGQFLNNRRHGFGILTVGGAEVYKGDWEKDAFNGQGRVRNMKNLTTRRRGQGLQGWVSYSGGFRDNLFSGRGTLFFQGGDKFIGRFQQGRACGQGTFYVADGSVEHAIWDSGRISTRL